MQCTALFTLVLYVIKLLLAGLTLFYPILKLPLNAYGCFMFLKMSELPGAGLSTEPACLAIWNSSGL